MTEHKGQSQHLNRGASSTEETKKGMLSELSMPAIAAASLGAVASFMCSNHLGIAGSLIGACVTSAVSTFTVQLSKPMITSSVEKIHDFPGRLVEHSTEQKHGEHSEVTQVLPKAEELERDDQHSRLAPEALRNELADRRAATIRRRLIAVSAAAAISALVVYAVIVNVATQGKGIGPTPSSIYTPAPVIQDQLATNQTTTQDTGADATATTTVEQSQSNATSTTGQSSKPSKTSNSSTQTNTSSTDTTTQNEGTVSETTQNQTGAQSQSSDPTATQTTDATSTDTSAQSTTGAESSPAEASPTTSADAPATN